MDTVRCYSRRKRAKAAVPEAQAALQVPQGGDGSQVQVQQQQQVPEPEVGPESLPLMRPDNVGEPGSEPHHRLQHEQQTQEEEEEEEEQLGQEWGRVEDADDERKTAPTLELSPSEDSGLATPAYKQGVEDALLQLADQETHPEPAPEPEPGPGPGPGPEPESFPDSKPEPLSEEEQEGEPQLHLEPALEDHGPDSLAPVAQQHESHEYQDDILNRADAIWQKIETLESTRKLPARGREPARCKTHWDFVLEEMAWLAKDFDRERKWKLTQAKKVALKLSKIKVDHEAKGVKRLKEERQRVRRLASNIAKDVKKFWVKIDKLLAYKHQLEAEEIKKRARDRHLDFLLGQTERYSTMLAETMLADPCLISAPKSPLLTSSAPFAPNAGTEAGSLLSLGHQHEDHVSREHLSPSSTANGAGGNELELEQHNKVVGNDSSATPKLEIFLGDTDPGVENANGVLPHPSFNKDVSSGWQVNVGMADTESTLPMPDKNASIPLGEGVPNNSEKPGSTRGGWTGQSLGSGCPKERELVHQVHHEKDDPVDASTLSIATTAEVEEDVVNECGATVGASIAVPSSSGHVDNLQPPAECLPGTLRTRPKGPDMHLETFSLSTRGSEHANEEDADERLGRELLVDAAAAAQSAQPTGHTFSTTKVRTESPFLLKHCLREYQHIGLDWLVTMYEKRLNGILADEMGLGKTIMTISLLALLACQKGIWGPHLIVVPTSVMLNWETEFMKWCPAFKVMTYFGNARERKIKRQGWSKPNSFHICITTYRLVIQDAKAFKRKKWKYLILDEAHLIKNWRSQRWQTLLNFNSKRRILLTGTPLQNDLMELWSLMHFLMPHVFQSHQQFRDWFSNPISGMVEGQEQVNKELVERLHNVLRPFLLRRLKQDVEKQLPMKYEHVVLCRLSKRQRNLYEDFMASSETQATLASGNFLGMINVLMQLRKVCNHPDLFEGRPIISSCDMPGLDMNLSSGVWSVLEEVSPMSAVDLSHLNLLIGNLEFEMSSWACEEIKDLATPTSLIEEISSTGQDSWGSQQKNPVSDSEFGGLIEEIQASLAEQKLQQRRERALGLAVMNTMRCSLAPIYGLSLRQTLVVEHPVYDVHKIKMEERRYFDFSSKIADMVLLPIVRMESLVELIEAFVFAIPAARALPPVGWFTQKSLPANPLRSALQETKIAREVSELLVPLRPVFVRRQLFFPDRRLLQFDCGKLQELASLLRRLKSEGHRALIFTQMTKMLDILESFINLYGYTYMRLDGSTKPEQRQILMQRFNTNKKIFLFILSTRSGGVGINLVGADTVIFYDSDWNPAMDLQAQDRCHRIGQTREVHIYRLVSESTVEENILKKANQKRLLDDLVIQSGSYNTEFFKKLDPMELLSGLRSGKSVGSAEAPGTADENKATASKQEVSNADVDAALKNAEDEADYMAMKRAEQEQDAENQEFTEEGFAGILDDEECADENGGVKALEEISPAQPVNGDANELPVLVSKESSSMLTTTVPAEPEEDIDMLADVRQMAAAAAAAGKDSISFEDQLQPVERYAMRLLEFWDGLPRKNTSEAQAVYEEKEWELDQLEKLKEEQEAEIDEDNEPLFYESWDTTFANEAYRQQVEVLVQQQENQRLEWEAINEEMYDADRAVEEAAATVVGAEIFKLKRKSKDKLKLKKTKFKSLRHDGFPRHRTEANLKPTVSDEFVSPSAEDARADMSLVPARSPSQRKRKAPKLLEEELLVEMEQRKLWKESAIRDRGAGKTKSKKGPSRLSNERALEFGDEEWPGSIRPESIVMPSPANASTKTPLKSKLSGMNLKKGPLVMLEREKKKDATKSLDQVPQADPWVPAEDAVLCAVLHEYGGNWQLASDALAGLPDGGVYRGRYRHPIHCRERFRQLLAQNASAANGDPTASKIAAANAPLKVTEEHTKRLLEVVQQLPDDEFLLQRHFSAVLEVVQKSSTRLEALGGSSGIISPHSGTFISLKSLKWLPSALSGLSDAELLIKNSGLSQASHLSVSALIEQASEVRSGGIDQALDVKTNSSQLDYFTQEPMADDEMTFIASLLVGPKAAAKGSVSPSGSGHVQSTGQRVSIEKLFDLRTMPDESSFSNGLRPLLTDIVDQRFRNAMKIFGDGDALKWVSAAGTVTGVAGAELPTRRMAGKKRPSRDASKPPKPKQARVQGEPKKGSNKTLWQPDIVESGSMPCQASGGFEKTQQLAAEAAEPEQGSTQRLRATELAGDGGDVLSSRSNSSAIRKANDYSGRFGGSPGRGNACLPGDEIAAGPRSSIQVKVLEGMSPLHIGVRTQGVPGRSSTVPTGGEPKMAGLHSRSSISRLLANSRGLVVLPPSLEAKVTSPRWSQIPSSREEHATTGASRLLPTNLWASSDPDSRLDNSRRCVGRQTRRPPEHGNAPEAPEGSFQRHCQDGEHIRYQVQAEQGQCKPASNTGQVQPEVFLGNYYSRSSRSHPQAAENPVWTGVGDHAVRESTAWVEDRPATHPRNDLFSASSPVVCEHSRGLLVEYQLSALEAARRLQGLEASVGFPGRGFCGLSSDFPGFGSNSQSVKGLGHVLPSSSFSEPYVSIPSPSYPSSSNLRGSAHQSTYQLSTHQLSRPSFPVKVRSQWDVSPGRARSVASDAPLSSSFQQDSAGTSNSPSL